MMTRTVGHIRAEASDEGGTPVAVVADPVQDREWFGELRFATVNPATGEVSRSIRSCRATLV